MRVKGATLQQVLLGAALILALCWNFVQASEIKGLVLSDGPTGTRAEVELDSPASFSTLTLRGPDRLVLDLPASRLRRGLPLPAGAGVVKAVRTGQPVAGTVRVVFDLAAPVAALKPRLETTVSGARLVVEWPGDGQGTSASTAAVAPAATSAPPAEEAASPSGSDPAATSAAATARLIASLPAVERAATTPPATSGVATASAAPGPTAPAPAAPAAPDPRSTADDAARAARIMAGASTSASAMPGQMQAGVSRPAESAAVPGVSPQAAATASPASPQGATKTVQQLMRGGMRPLVVAIDAGHGGQDPGARGGNGSREKDITLAIARELARQVDATPGLKAYLTRDSDVFIPLAQRYHKARAAKADLFVSIHADAFTNPQASGSSVFVLSQRGASSQAARWLASQENAADLVGGVRLQDKDNTLASVLLDLSQSATMKASEDIANHVLSGLKRLGKTHKPHVERANFVVLRSPDVPSMLVETAFITNPEEERRLNDPRHRTELARAILDGVNAYFTRQPPPGTLFAARAEAAANPTASAAGSR